MLRLGAVLLLALSTHHLGVAPAQALSAQTNLQSALQQHYTAYNNWPRRPDRVQKQLGAAHASRWAPVLTHGGGDVDGGVGDGRSETWPCRVSAREGRNAQRVLDAILASSGGWLEVEYD